MKRQILTLAAMLALLLAGAVFAQSPQNTTAPGPTTQQEPGQTNNNLPNPGNPLPLNQPAQQPVPETEVDTTTTTTPTDTTTAEPLDTTTTTTTTTPTTLETETDSQDITTTTETDTSGTYTGTAGDNNSLPATASELPTVALIGLLALGAAFLVRARRHA